MKDLLLYIARNLVEHPDGVTVTEIQGEQELTLELRVALRTWARSSVVRAASPRSCARSCAPLPIMRIAASMSRLSADERLQFK